MDEELKDILLNILGELKNINVSLATKRGVKRKIENDPKELYEYSDKELKDILKKAGYTPIDFNNLSDEELLELEKKYCHR